MEKFMYETEETKQLKAVYEHLQDEESRKIYVARSLFSLSDNRLYMYDVIRNMSVSKYLLGAIQKHYNQKMILFGAGTWGDAITKIFPELNWNFIVDNKKNGKQLNGYYISNLSDIQNYQECFFVIAVLFKYREIVNQLLSLGIRKKNLLVLGEYAEKKQYFDLPQLNISNDEVFIDAGGFNGDTSSQFAKKTLYKYKKIYLFEPNAKSAEKCRNELKNLHDCEIIQKGTWSKNELLTFLEQEEGSRQVNTAENNTVTIEATTIDSILKGEEATFIKMDVEGAELNSLIGAKNTIIKYKPRLAIYVYHRRNDIWEIHKLLLKYNPDYKFYLRIYSFTGNDAVLYAI